MTEANVDVVQVEDFPANVSSGTGTPRRLAIAHIQYRSNAGDDTIGMGTYVPNTADVVGIVYDTMNNAVTSTATTWSGTVITTAADGGAGVGELGVIVRFT